MSRFKNAIRDVFVTYDVDLFKYPNVRRKVRKLYPKPTDEMLMLVVNFRYHKRLAVSLNKNSFTGNGVSYPKVKQTVKTLIKDGYIVTYKPRWNDPNGKGTTTTYERTALFESTFAFKKLPRSIYVTASALTKGNKSSSSSTKRSLASQKRALSNTNLASISALSTYFSLVSKVKLSLSNGGQVFQDVDLERRQGARLYQMGMHGYQSIRKEDRAFLLIDGVTTVELDYMNLHPCMLLNKVGVKSPKTDMYSRVLKELGIRKTKARRSAMKHIFLIVTNIDTVQGFYGYLGRDSKEYRNHLKGHTRPKDIYNAILKLYPKLKPYVCTGKHSFGLQVEDSDIMIDVLETLAKMGIVGLPLHDSVICQEQHESVVEQVMKDVYKQHMKFDIEVK
ncbi:MAG: hypothetical protein HQ553_14710 [Chloroflexi bacterium]|nr:hypothetical protein [Chloroflexota bacterium]